MGGALPAAVSTVRDNAKEANIMAKSNENINCAVCGKEARYSAWRNSKGEIVCPNCVSPKDREAAFKRAFPYGVPDKFD
jgi:formylmethanofuran dehydrogenase subunit E